VHFAIADIFVTFFFLLLILPQRVSELVNECVNMSNPKEEESFSRAARAAEDLYHLRDTYFPPNPDDRISKLQHESDLALNLLDSIPPGQFLSNSHIKTLSFTAFQQRVFFSHAPSTTRLVYTSCSTVITRELCFFFSGVLVEDLKFWFFMTSILLC